MTEGPFLPPGQDQDAPADALPARPWLRRLVIGIYVLIVLCVVISLLGLLFYSGFLDFPFEGPLPRRETI